MAIISITQGVTGLAGVSPSMIFIKTNDTVATVTAPGYLGHARGEGYTFSNDMVALVTTTDDATAWYQVTVDANGIVDLDVM